MKIFNFLTKTAIEEGLIKTVDVAAAMRIIDKNYPNVVTDTSSEEDMISVVFRPKLLKDEEIRSLFKLIDNLGWFPAIFNYDFNSNNKFNSIESFILKIKDSTKVGIKFEKKIDKEHNKQKLYYHATKRKYSRKIEKIGLVPRSQSKLGTHPERIYLAKSFNYALEILEMFYDLDDSDPNWVIYEIDSSKIPNFKTMVDPNYIGGVYSLNNIPPSALRPIKIFNMDK
jgi:hypothetical protein